MSGTFMDVVDNAGELCEKSGDIEFQWIIKDVKSIIKCDTYRRSRWFSVAGIRFRMELCPVSNKSKSGRLFSVAARVAKDCKSSKSVDMTVNVKIADGTELGNVECSSIVQPGRTVGKIILKLISVKVLTVTCVMRVNEEIHSTARFDTVADDLTDLFLSQKATDVTLIVEHEEIPAHKSVLSARSPVFASMFEVDMKEKRTGVVNIEDIPAEPFRDFLLYLYSGKVKNLSGKAINLYKIANQYDVQPLKTACIRSLSGNLSLDSMFDTLLFADFFNEMKLKFDIEQFFNHNFKEIVHSPKWISFLGQHLLLGNDLLMKLTDKITTSGAKS